jgi:polyvinyl alcohol dehydrogenase (cytochrome)
MKLNDIIKKRAWSSMMHRILWMLSATVMVFPHSAGAQNSNSHVLGVFASRCGACHDKSNADSRAPLRDALASLTAERILAAVTTGAMATHADGLSNQEKRELAEYVAGRPLGDPASRYASAMPNQCTSNLALGNPFTGPSWIGWSPDSTNARFQPTKSAGMTGDQVPRLKLKWAFGFPGASAGWGQPTIAAGWLWVGSDNGMVYALNAQTGCVRWSFEAQAGVRTAIVLGAIKGITGVRYAAYFGDQKANVYAVNAETGKQLWMTHVDDSGADARITAAPAFDAASGRLFVPVSSWEEVVGPALSYECCKFQGSVAALDATTGRSIWKTHTIPERPSAFKKNAAGGFMYGPSGAAVWNTPTLDFKRNALYIGTGNGYIPVPDGNSSDAVIAFDMKTGQRLWSRQLTANDFDANGCGMTAAERDKNCPGEKSGPNDDIPTSPILHTFPNGRQIIIASQESRRITILDPDREGQVLWQKTPSDEQTSTTGNLGPADDGELLYVPLAFRGQAAQAEGGSRMRSDGGMTAVKLDNGERVWTTILPGPTNCADPQSRWCSSANQAGATAIPGAVFTGDVNGTLRAFSSHDGGVLWEFNTNRNFETINGVKAHGGTIGGPGPVIVGGMLYTGSGYVVVGSLPGNVLLAFGVD